MFTIVIKVAAAILTITFVPHPHHNGPTTGCASSITPAHQHTPIVCKPHLQVIYDGPRR